MTSENSYSVIQFYQSSTPPVRIIQHRRDAHNQAGFIGHENLTASP